MITLIINNEQDYLNLIADAIEFGVHEANPYATLDEDGMNISDSFNLFPVEELYELLGVYLDDRPRPDEITLMEDDEGEWEQQEAHIEEWDKDYRAKLKVFPENPYTRVPKTEDYPIILYWHWFDTFDRWGDDKPRVFLWWSFNKTVDTSKDSLRLTQNKWEGKFAEEVKKLTALQKKLRNG